MPPALLSVGEHGAPFVDMSSVFRNLFPSELPPCVEFFLAQARDFDFKGRERTGSRDRPPFENRLSECWRNACGRLRPMRFAQVNEPLMLLTQSTDDVYGKGRPAVYRSRSAVCRLSSLRRSYSENSAGFVIMVVHLIYKPMSASNKKAPAPCRGKRINSARGALLVYHHDVADLREAVELLCLLDG